MYVCIIQEYNIKVNDFAIFFAKKRKNFAENAKYYVILSQNDMEKHENRRFSQSPVRMFFERDTV